MGGLKMKFFIHACSAHALTADHTRRHLIFSLCAPMRPDAPRCAPMRPADLGAPRFEL